MSVDHRPARASALLSLVAGVASVALAGTATPLALLAGATGAVALAAGLVAASRSWLTVGAVGLLVGVLLAAVAGGDLLPTLAAAVATLVAWDLAEHAVGLGEQVGRAAATLRGELVHAGTAVAVGAAAVLVVVAGSRAAGSLPVAALVAALLAGVVLLAALRS